MISKSCNDPSSKIGQQNDVLVLEIDPAMLRKQDSQMELVESALTAGRKVLLQPVIQSRYLPETPHSPPLVLQTIFATGIGVFFSGVSAIIAPDSWPSFIVAAIVGMIVGTFIAKWDAQRNTESYPF
ncbi:hypothetical protein ACN9MY_07765 [Pseudoduganella sp. R-31]|uniref:hypothetical protein n=1 Tax=Pseudoduganella sp. R-31 TaxID=3404060 RepID=UPI003CEFA669